MATHAHNMIAALSTHSGDFTFRAELAEDVQFLALSLFTCFTVMMRPNLALKTKFSVTARGHEKGIETQPC